MGLKIKVFYNTGIQIFGRFFTGFVTYLVTLILVRQYGVVGFGEFVKIISFVSFFYIMADFGANAIVVKKMTQEKGSEERLLGNLISLRVFLSVVLMFVAIGILAFLPQGTESGFTKTARFGILLCSLTIITQSLITSTNAFFQKTMSYDKSVIAAIVGYLFTLSCAFLFSKLQVSIAVVSLAYVFGGILTVLISFLFIRQKIVPLFDFDLWRLIFMSSLPLGLTLILNIVYFKADSFILTLTRPTQEVGVYGLAYKFFEIALVLPTFYMNSLYPVFLEKMKTNKIEFLHILKRSGLFLFGVSIFATIAIIILAPVLVNFTSGARQIDFQGAISALRVLSLSLPFFFISSILMWLLITCDKQKLLPLLYAVSMVFNISLNIILIPRYGYMAAAFTTVVSEAVVLALLLIPSRRILSN